MKKTTRRLALARTTIALLSSNLHLVAGGRIYETGPSDDGTCGTQRYCNTDNDTYTADCATWRCSRFLDCQ